MLRDLDKEYEDKSSKHTSLAIHLVCCERVSGSAAFPSKCAFSIVISNLGSGEKANARDHKEHADDPDNKNEQRFSELDFYGKEMGDQRLLNLSDLSSKVEGGGKII